MAENEEEKIIEKEEAIEQESIPAKITDEYFKEFLPKAIDFVRNLRQDGNYETAGIVSRIVTVLEYVGGQWKEEEQKNAALIEQHVDATKRIEEAAKFSQKDHDVIQQLKKEISSAWLQSDASIVREQNTSESLAILKERNAEMSQKLERFSTRTYEDTEEFGQNSGRIIKEVELMFIENEELHKRLFVQRAYSDELQKQLESSQDKIRDLLREWDSATNSTFENKRRVENLTKKIETMTEEQDTLLDSLAHYKKSAEERHNRLRDSEKLIIELSDEMNEIRSDNSQINAARTKINEVLNAYKSELRNNRIEMKQFQNYTRLKDDENRKLIAELEQVRKKIESQARKITSIERTISSKDQEIVARKNEISTVEIERDTLKKACDNMTKENEKLSKKAEIQMKEYEKLNATILTIKQENEEIKKEAKELKSQIKIAVEQEKIASRKANRLQWKLESVESEKLYFDSVIKDLNEDIKVKSKRIEECENEIEKVKKKSEKFIDDYNLAVRHAKKAESKYQQCHEKEGNVKYRMNVYANQIRANDHRMAGKIDQIVKLIKQIENHEKTIFDIQADHSKTRDTLRMCRVDFANLQNENNKLVNQIRESDAKVRKMKTQYDVIIQERDYMATQMLRCADEKALIETEMTTQRMTIDRGNATYNERVEDIRVLKCEVRNLQSKCNVLKRALENTADMRQEVLQLHRKLNQERVKSKVLCEEMTTPMNVHRWRKLSNIDPSRMELIKKCQKLQRKSINQFYQISKADEIIKLLNEKISEQQKEIEKRPSVDVQEKLLYTRVQMKKNEVHMKAAIAISRATEGELNFKDLTICELQKNLNELKSQLFQEKREKQKLAEKLRKGHEKD